MVTLKDYNDITHEKIDNFCWLHKKEFAHAESLFSRDDNHDRAEDFTDDKLKILVVFLTDAESRSLSNTFNAISTIAKRGAGKDNVVLDCSYFPQDPNCDKFDAANIPYIFGQICHQPASFYDVIFLSSAVISEIVNLPRILYHSGIGLTVEQRNEQKAPLIMMGGAAANEEFIAFGPIIREGQYIGKSLADVVMFGYGEGLIDPVVHALYSYKKDGFDLHDRENIRERLIADNVEHDYLFFPDKYEWEYEDDNWTIKNVKKLDPRLPDKCKYNTIRLASVNDLGWDSKVFDMRGENSDCTDFQISSGCSGASSCCSFCMEASVAGGYREMDLETVQKKIKQIMKDSAPNTISPFSFNLNYYYRFFDMLACIGQNASNISMHNERMDVIANSPDQMMLAKRLGLKRIPAAVEGFGERLRNGLLNKNLTRETLMKGMKVISDLHLMHIKIGFQFQ